MVNTGWMDIKYTNNSRDLASTFCHCLVCYLHTFDLKILQKCHFVQNAQPLTNRSFVPKTALFLLQSASQAVCVSKLAVSGWVWQKFSPRASGGEGQSCPLGRSQSLQLHRSDLEMGWCWTIFFSFNYKNLGQSWFCVYFETICMEQCVDAFRCQDEQDQKYCFFTVQKDAVVSLLLLKMNISTSYPTSDSAIAKSNMTSYPWKQFMKANLHSPLILPELLGKIRDFLLSFRVM